MIDNPTLIIDRHCTLSSSSHIRPESHFPVSRALSANFFMGFLALCMFRSFWYFLVRALLCPFPFLHIPMLAATLTACRAFGTHRMGRCCRIRHAGIQRSRRYIACVCQHIFPLALLFFALPMLLLVVPMDAWMSSGL